MRGGARRRAMVRPSRRQIYGIRDLPTTNANYGHAKKIEIYPGERYLESDVITWRIPETQFELYSKFRWYKKYVDVASLEGSGKGLTLGSVVGESNRLLGSLQCFPPQLRSVIEIRETPGVGTITAWHSTTGAATIATGATIINTWDPEQRPANSVAFLASAAGQSPAQGAYYLQGKTGEYGGWGMPTLYDSFDRPFFQRMRIGVKTQPYRFTWGEVPGSGSSIDNPAATDGTVKKQNTFANPRIYYRLYYAENGHKLLDWVPMARKLADGTVKVGMYDRVAHVLRTSQGTKQFSPVYTKADDDKL